MSRRKIVFSKIKRHTQSSIHERVKDILPRDLFEKPFKLTQSRKYAQKNIVKVIFSEGKAYWIKDNVFYTAETIAGKVVDATIKPLDTESLSKRELNKLLSILDDLKEGIQDDSSSPWNE